MGHLAQSIHERFDIARGQPRLALGRLHDGLGVRTDYDDFESGPDPEITEVGRQSQGHLVATTSQLGAEHHHGLGIAARPDRDESYPHFTSGVWRSRCGPSSSGSLRKSGKSQRNDQGWSPLMGDFR